MKKENKTNIILFSIFSVCMFLRLFKLGSIPYAMHIDEMGLLYNVQSLLNFGTDQAGNTWPLLLSNYHSEQSAMYTYLALICCKLFGNSLFVLRLPAVLNMVLIFIFGNKIVRKIYDNDKINIIFSLLLTVSPYFVLSTRMALDCNLMLGFSTMFLHLFIKALDSEKIIDAIIAGISCGVVLYTYVLSYIALPIFLVIMFIYLLKIKKINKQQVAAFTVPVLLLALPLIVVQIINVFELKELVVFGITFPNFETPRHNDISVLSIIANFASPLLYMLYTPQRLYECIFAYGNFQWVLVPFLLIGIVLNIQMLIKNKAILWRRILTTFWLAVYITCTVVHKDMTTWHLNGLMFISLIFIFDGLKWCIVKIKNKDKKLILIGAVLVLYMISTISFLGYYYFGNYATEEANSYYVYEDIKPAIEKANEIKMDKQQIYILLPSMIYRVNNDIPYFNPISSYSGAKEEQIQIDGYIFDMGANILRKPEINAIYIVGNCYEDYRRVLEELNMEVITIGSYTIYKGVDIS